MFKIRFDQLHLNDKCLTFLALYGRRTDIADESERLRVGQTYSLETGLVGWPDPVTGQQLAPLSLGNSRLSGWEPMSAEKFELMALERGIIGEDIIAPGRMLDASIVTVVVSPQGLVFHWDHSGTVSISHVSQLATIPQPLVHTSMEAWHIYKPKHDIVVDIGGYEGPPPTTLALVDKSGRTPNPRSRPRFPKPRDPRDLRFTHLGEAARNIAPLLIESNNYTFEDYTPAAAEFVQQQFGVDVDNVDWHAANKARLISNSFAHSTPFDPAAACSALRLAIVNNTVKHTASAAIDHARTAAEQAFNHDLATRIQQHLSPKPTP